MSIFIFYMLSRVSINEPQIKLIAFTNYEVQLKKRCDTAVFTVSTSDGVSLLSNIDILSTAPVYICITPIDVVGTIRRT